MTERQLTSILIKLDGVLALMQDIYEILAEEATKVEVTDAISDSL